MNDNPRKLAGLLEGRQDWRPETQDREQQWHFGVSGASRLIITPEPDGFRMYRADQDVSWVIPRVEAVAAWLGEHEHEHAGPTALQVELKRELDSRPGAAGV